jgi:hypothetical protein
MKKIGILYICTGEYDKFWNDFFSHSQKYFLNDCELHYFIFTDSNELLSNKNNNIHAIYQEKMEWPYPTLLRYKIFTDNKDAFTNMDYLIFCNANLLFQKEIVLEELFGNKKMLATLHPGYFNKTVDKFPYENNEKSLAYINRNERSKYVCGGFNGGARESFLLMSKLLSDNINEDISNNIIALWHDESHFNNYVENNRDLFNIIDASFCYPESRNLKLDKKIIVLDKDKVISIKHKGLGYSLRYYILKYLRNTKNLMKDFFQ